MHVFVPAFMSIRHWDFLVVSANDRQVRGGARSREGAEAHAAKSIVRTLAGGQELLVVAKSKVTF